MEKVVCRLRTIEQKHVGSVRIELTIDGSLRYASVLQRVITKSADPFVIIYTGLQRPLEPVAMPLGHDPCALIGSPSADLNIMIASRDR